MELVDNADAQPESYVKLRLLYDTELPSTIEWAGKDDACRELARKTIEDQNQKCVWVKFKHTQYILIVQNAADQHHDVKVFHCIEHGGMHYASVTNGALVELECMPADGDEDAYARVHLSNLDDPLIAWDGPDDPSRKQAREVIEKQHGTVFVKRKHLKLLSPPLRDRWVAVKNFETRFDNVKVYESLESALQGRIAASIHNLLDVELADVLCFDPEQYMQVRIPDLEKIRWERAEAREHIQRSSNIVFIKRKHLHGPSHQIDSLAGIGSRPALRAAGEAIPPGSAVHDEQSHWAQACSLWPSF
jgi:hypothetical protein